MSCQFTMMCKMCVEKAAFASEMDIRRMRNERNLKASQLARLAGHEELALMLRAVPRSPSVGSRDRVRSSRRRRRGQRGSMGSVTHTHTHSRPSISPEAVMDVLIAVSRILTLHPVQGLASAPRAEGSLERDLAIFSLD